MEKDWKVLLVLSILLCFISYNFAISHNTGSITYGGGIDTVKNGYDDYQINVMDIKTNTSAYIKINNV
ncbi:hypothetical protein J7J90_02430, partial [Candidatus Micrarchaeota archaeon]|nr:hypothetical protein [Candidatus Micrarchaeota archaeon]